MGLNLRTAGRPKANVVAEVERDLDEVDISSLLQERASPVPEIAQFRERHHTLARLIAEGRKQTEAAMICRYTTVHVSNLMQSPAFLELVAHYREVVNVEFVDFQKKLADLAIDAATLLQERMEDKPNEISDALLLQVVQVGADRTGHGPSQKTEVNVKIGLADRLAAATQRAAIARDITPKETEE